MPTWSAPFSRISLEVLSITCQRCCSVAAHDTRGIAPHTTERGLYCEFHVDETPRDLWMTDGVAPPPSGSEAEKLWVQENRPVPY
ncbi:tautomerase family protein [Kitasatospora cystarginea]|uniref:tautomerase family protein n=1 Tax=Kitasatospora cystarginea TaxID=58350 RepID=UPI0031D14196